MKDNDVVQLSEFIQANLGVLQGVKTAIICSPDQREIQILSEKFPGVQITTMDVKVWNLDDECSQSSDLVLASNVFICAHDPKKWISNVLAKTRFFIMLDNCKAYRGNVEGETSPSTGDVMRYTMPPVMTAVLPTAFDLNSVRDHIISIVPYECQSHCSVPGYEQAISFLALFKK